MSESTILPPLTKLLSRLWQYIPARRRQQLLLLLLLMLASSLLEVVSIGAVLPFLAAITSPEKLMSIPSVVLLMRWINISTAGQLQAMLTVAFIIAALSAGLVRVLLIWCNTRLAYAIGEMLSHEIYWKTLCQPYAIHLGRNSSVVISTIINKVSIVIASVINPVLTLISSLFLMLAIFIILLSIDVKVTLFAIVGFGLIYAGIIKSTRNFYKRNGKTVAMQSTQVIKVVQEGLGGIRDILLDGSQSTHCKIFQQANEPLRRAQGGMQFLAQSPRYMIEAFGMVLVALAALTLTMRPEGITSAMPVLGALAVGAQRILPLMQTSYMSWSSLIGSKATFIEVLEFLDQNISVDINKEDITNISFSKTIQLRDIIFSYSKETKKILNNVSLVIEKGSRVGIVGSTGSGKSTLIDLIMGLLKPDSGVIEIDGAALEESNLRSWQEHIAHVPQNIFLSDNTIAENIAFGVSRDFIDMDRVRLVATQANIASEIEKWPLKYATKVGERGIRLSGGQLQRIGIARALYKNTDVIIFDEATSALDSQTEAQVMAALESLTSDLTIIIIAHRLSTLRQCSSVFEITEAGNICIRSAANI